MTMKKCMERLMAAVLLLTTMFALSGCSDDEGSGSVDGNLVGTWKCTSLEDAVEIWGDQYLQFREDGVFIEVDVTPALGAWDEAETEVMRGRWKQNGTSLRISGGDFSPSTSEITELTDTQLTLVTMGIPLSYKRVDDAEIEPYL